MRSAGGGKAGAADRGSLATVCAPRGRAELAEPSGASAPAPGGNKRGRRWGGRRKAGPGAAGAGTPLAASRFSGRRAEPPAGGRAGGKPGETSFIGWCPGCANTYLSAGHLLELQLCLVKEHPSALLRWRPDHWKRWKLRQQEGGMERFREGFTEEVTLDWTGREEKGMV